MNSANLVISKKKLCQPSENLENIS